MQECFLGSFSSQVIFSGQRVLVADPAAIITCTLVAWDIQGRCHLDSIQNSLSSSCCLLEVFLLKDPWSEPPSPIWGHKVVTVFGSAPLHSHVFQIVLVLVRSTLLYFQNKSGNPLLPTPFLENCLRSLTDFLFLFFMHGVCRCPWLVETPKVVTLPRSNLATRLAASPWPTPSEEPNSGRWNCLNWLPYKWLLSVLGHLGGFYGNGILFREDCFGRENSLSSAANSVSSAKKTRWLRSGTQIIGGEELTELSPCNLVRATRNSLSSVFETVLSETVFGPFPSCNTPTPHFQPY